jgi:hypothetical protein
MIYRILRVGKGKRAESFQAVLTTRDEKVVGTTPAARFFMGKGLLDVCYWAASKNCMLHVRENPGDDWHHVSLWAFK